MRKRGRPVRDEGDANELLERWERSGLSMQTWCDQNGVARHSLQWWRPRIEALRRSGGVIRVAEVVLPGPVTAGGLRVVLPNGVEIAVPDDFRAETLSRVLAVVTS